MFSDVLAALRRMREVHAIVVVTADPAAQSLASDDATVLRDAVRAGQSVATQIGIRHAMAEGFERVLLVPGDTPLIDPGEVDRLLARTAADGIAVGIVADRHGTGTNALVLTPPDVMAPSFGPDSRARHVARAEELGLAHRVEEVASLAHDVDTPEDLEALREAIESGRSGAQRTRGALRQLTRSGARVRPRPEPPGEPGARPEPRADARPEPAGWPSS